LWRGLEQTAFQNKARLIGKRHHGPREKTNPSGCEGIDTLMRRTILVKSNSFKSLRNQAVSGKFKDKGSLFC
jgi:hypothetical protein